MKFFQNHVQVLRLNFGPPDLHIPGYEVAYRAAVATGASSPLSGATKGSARGVISGSTVDLRHPTSVDRSEGPRGLSRDP